MIDLTEDNRKEIVLWDKEKMYIYTQDNILEQTDKQYVPLKFPYYNASNYRREYAYPVWK